MGFVIGKKGGAPRRRPHPDRTERTGGAQHPGVGAGPRRGGRGFLGPEPTTTISLDGLQFTRLCGGRPMTPRGRRTIDYDGDVAVGERIVSNLSYVI